MPLGGRGFGRGEIKGLGDLFAPMLAKTKRVKLERFL
jgi:hypothetical protein